LRAGAPAGEAPTAAEAATDTETLAGAASLLSCAEALSFFAPLAFCADAVCLVWGAREVMGADLKKLFNLQYVQLAETDSSNSQAQQPISEKGRNRLD
jgi:hypothetical protein